MIQHKLAKRINAVQLSVQLSTALGKSVGVQVGETDIGDELVIVDNETGEWMDVDEKAVKAVLDAHVYVDPDSVPTPVEALVEALESATTVAGLKAALVDHFTGPAIQAGERRAARIEMKSNGPAMVQGVRPGPFMTGGAG